MSVATIDYWIDETVLEAHDREVAEITTWLERRASLRRAFTTVYTPRHRADGPAL